MRDHVRQVTDSGACDWVRDRCAVSIPIVYRGRQLDCGYRIDFVINRELVIEVKSAVQTLPIHKAQLLTYLKLTGLPQGLLLNFCVPTLKDGITSVILTKESSFTRGVKP